MKLDTAQIKAFVVFAATLESLVPGQKMVTGNLAAYKAAGLVRHDQEDDSVRVTKKGRNLILKAQQMG